MTDYSIKIAKNTQSIGEQQQTIQLLNSKDIQPLKTKYKLLIIRLVQVAVKPLTRLGLNKAICICLRDAKHNNIRDSILWLLKSNMAHGPVYFNCYPNLELSCIDMMNPSIKLWLLTYKQKDMTWTLDQNIYLYDILLSHENIFES